MTAEAYMESFKPLRDLMFAQSIYAMTTIVGYGIYFEKKSKYSLIAVTAGAILNLGLNFILIPKFGIQAAALTTLLGYLLNYLITLYFSKEVYPCQYGEIRVGLISALLYFISFMGENTGFIVKIIIWILCAAVATLVFKDILKRVIMSIRNGIVKGYRT